MDTKKTKIQLRVQRIVNHVRFDLGLYGPNLEFQYFGLLEEVSGQAIRAIYKCAVYEELKAQFARDWWQAFKERWFPKWLLRRFPVEYTQIFAKHKFPHWKKELGTEYVEVYYKSRGNDGKHGNLYQDV